MSEPQTGGADLASDPVAWLRENPKLANRQVFRHALARFAEQESRLILLEADLGGGADPFEARHKSRYFNLGICEATMLDMACGMAHVGHIVFAHTFAPFGAMRACEQVRLGMAYPQANVKLVCDYGGVSGAFFGPTHHAIEDLAILRAMPGMTVFSPADGLETILATRAMIDHHGPVYMRLGRNRVSRLDAQRDGFALGRAHCFREGTDVGLIAHGEVGVSVALEAAGRLEGQGVSARVVNMHTLKPLDEAAVLETAERTRLLVTLEEHNILGGLGGAVCETVCAHGLGRQVLRIGIQDRYDPLAGSHESLLLGHGLDGAAVSERILSSLSRPRPVAPEPVATRRT
ncbi:transketolase family protein [Vitiosangium sp. GDMCC 1.1324]|uniref:transketolase family protein n=1 Tax=Vitiosangium sp. (strain GDMCC 1.1324) TaxID=2138576 RepID=UPI000D3BD5C2|nr:transketolase C-terminal domain-containing protein [Vitiosangium sp. GDMCC 1.1324]PTL75055.1 transketolase [Vitiosangium sp. GDMCC 1.1324]